MLLLWCGHDWNIYISLDREVIWSTQAQQYIYTFSFIWLFICLPRHTSLLHVVGSGHVITPDIILPFLKTNNTAENIARMNPNPHVSIHTGHLSQPSTLSSQYHSSSDNQNFTWWLESSPAPFWLCYWHGLVWIWAAQTHSSNSLQGSWSSCTGSPGDISVLHMVHTVIIPWLFGQNWQRDGSAWLRDGRQRVFPRVGWSWQCQRRGCSHCYVFGQTGFGMETAAELRSCWTSFLSYFSSPRKYK